MAQRPIDKALRLIKQTGVLRSRDLTAHNIPRQYLRILQERGLIRRIDRGLYALVDAPVTESHSLVEAVKLVPGGAICLLSALRMHGLTTQNPAEVWMAVSRKARKPKAEYPPLRIVRFSGKALTEGIEERNIEGVLVRVYNPAKTVADCFKYRNKIGLDVALEALRDCWRQKKATMDELWKAARICRVANVMKPYIEMVVGEKADR